MCDDETLVRFHFGELSPSESRRVQQLLDSNPEAAARLQELRKCLPDAEAPAENPVASGAPPESLAERTVDVVLSGDDLRLSEEDAAPASAGRRYSLTEVASVAVAAGILGMLVLPAVQASREAARRLACGDNLRAISQALQSYGEDHGGTFPRIEPGMNAGMFSVRLVEGGYMDRGDMQASLVCPSSQLAEMVRANQAAVHVPTLEELRRLAADQLAEVRRWMSGSYAYRLGHLAEGVYVYPRSRADCRSAILADAPTRDEQGALVSRNHGACGQNVLFQDGHVEFVTSCWSPCQTDHLFLNDAGEVAAGRRPRDVVLAAGDVTPGVVRIIRVGR